MNILGEVTERAALKAEVLAKFVECLPVAFIVADERGIIYLINRQTELLFGYDESELLGQPVEILIAETLREIHVKHRADYVEEPHTRVMGSGLQLSARKKSGKEFLADITFGPMITTDGMYIVVVVTRRREETSA
jgi:PAS domain S-box-containing protein